MLNYVFLFSQIVASTFGAFAPKETSAYFSEWSKRLTSELPLTRGHISTESSVLVIVDMQNDFIGEFSYTDDEIKRGESPCHGLLGSSAACFGVKEGNIVAETIGAIVEMREFRAVIASMDDHKEDHCSFVVSANTKTPPLACKDDFALSNCDDTAFHHCIGTKYAHTSDKGDVYGPFPPHCTRGTVGTHLDSGLFKTLSSRNPTNTHIAIKGLDGTTDSFGVFRYSPTSFGFYDKAGLMDDNKPSPAVLIRSMLTWEKHMNTSTGASTYTVPFGNQYYQPPPFSEDGNPGVNQKQTTEELVSKYAPDSIFVTGLAGDWCVLDTALNAKAYWKEKEVYIILDATRPSYLPAAAAKFYMKANATNQEYDGGIWLHDPSDVAAVLRAAGVKLILANQLVNSSVEL